MRAGNQQHRGTHTKQREGARLGDVRDLQVWAEEPIVERRRRQRVKQRWIANVHGLVEGHISKELAVPPVKSSNKLGGPARAPG